MSNNNKDKKYYYGGGLLKNGSEGADVASWQKYLADQGYFTGNIDGVFGDYTESATKEYQRSRGISDDGMVGATTFGDAGFINYNDYGTFDWDKQGEYDKLLTDYTEREPFKFDVNSAALYNQYKDIYTEQAGLASNHAMGQAAAMSGGYGNSYAASVGAQAYQNYMKELAGIPSELEQSAYSKYITEGEQMKSQIDALAGDYTKQLGEWELGYGLAAQAKSDAAAYDSAIAAKKKAEADKIEAEEELEETIQTTPWDLFDQEAYDRQVAADGGAEAQAAADELIAALQTGELDYKGALSAAKELLATSIISPEDYKNLHWMFTIYNTTKTVGTSPES